MLLARTITLILALNLAGMPCGLPSHAQEQAQDAQEQAQDAQAETQPPSAAPVVADESIWSTDAQASAKSAADAKQDLLLLFTGSDWCAPCIKLNKDILSQPAFTQAAPQQFTLVKFDFPQNIEQSDQLKRQNQQWSEQFGIEGFPTIVLVDHQLRPYAFTGLREEGPQAYLQHLNELRQAREKRDAALAKANEAVGLDRARLLDEALSSLDADIVEVYYEDLVNEIGTLDPDDEAGLRTKYFAARDREMRKAVMSNISMVARLQKPQQAIEFIDAALDQVKLPMDMWLQAQMTKLRLLRKMDRFEDAQKLLTELIDAPGVEGDARQRLIINKAFYLVSRGDTNAALTELQSQIANSPDNLLITIAKGELHDSLGQYELAIKAYDQSIVAAAARPEVLVEVVGAKADALYEMNQIEEAISTLDRIAENTNVPPDLRAEALLHKSLMLRQNGRRRAAILAENKAVETVETPDEKAEVQKLVEQLRRKFDKPSPAADAPSR